jgi:predicted RNA-binding Zn-ribbon protein involved in translation (DUF1610 family)
MEDNYNCPKCGLELRDIHEITHDVARGYCVSCMRDFDVLTANNGIIMNEVQTKSHNKNTDNKKS